MTRASLLRIRRQLKAFGISQGRVAQEARVDRSTVCHVLAGRLVSARIVGVMMRILEEAQGYRDRGEPLPDRLIAPIRPVEESLELRLEALRTECEELLRLIDAARRRGAA